MLLSGGDSIRRPRHLSPPLHPNHSHAPSASGALTIMNSERMIELLEKQKRDLVSRFLEQHEEARNNQSFVDRIMSNISDLLIILSTDLEILQASNELYHVLGQPQDGTQLTLEAILDQETIATIRSMLESGEFRDLETRLETSSGQKIPVTMRGQVFTTPSGRVLYMLNASDRRDVYRVLDQMREVQNQLIHSGRLASLGEMAAGIGHELTQPLNTILLLARNCLRALESEPLDRKLMKENLQTVIERVNHSSSIIRSLKGFASKVQDELVPTRLNVIIFDILSFLESQLQIAGIEVDLAIDEDVVWVLGQEVRLEQVFLNIIQNSIQAMANSPEPRLTIRTFRHQGMDPANLQPRNYAATSITDNGPGIAREHLDKIFDPFFTTKEVGTGMGLGLSIVDRIVRGCGGHITVQSTPQVATTFIVYLPELKRK